MAETDNDQNRALERRLTVAKEALAEAELAGDKVRIRRLRSQVDQLTGELITRNMRLVQRLAGKFSDSGDDDERVSAGRLALVKAVQSWDPAKGNLSTWATPWVKKAIMVEVGNEHRLKAHAFAARAKVLAANRELYARFGRTPTDAELAKETGVAEQLVHYLRVNETAGKTRSLNKVVGEEGTELGDIAGPVCDSAEDEVLGSMYEDNSDLELENRSPDELKVLFKDCDIWEAAVGIRHLGADGARSQDYQVMSPTWGVSRETLRKIFNRFAEKIT